MRLFAPFAALALALAACSPAAVPPAATDNFSLAQRYNVLAGPGVSIADYPAEAFDTARLDAFVRQAAVDIQRESFRIEAEICASVLMDRQGNYRMAYLNPGTADSCVVNLPRNGELMVADFHTHGVYLPAYENELPSPPDVFTNEQSGVPGYVTTPAGRMWYVDNDTGDIRLVCRSGCLPVDPNTPASTREPMPTTISREALLARY